MKIIGLDLTKITRIKENDIIFQSLKICQGHFTTRHCLYSTVLSKKTYKQAI